MRGAPPPPLLLAGALLLALATPTPPPHHADAAAAASLLVLSDLCQEQALYARAQALLALVSDNTSTIPTVSLLSHEDICGEWRKSVSSAALVALGGGRRVALAGRRGDAAVCGALRHATRVLRRGDVLLAPACDRLAALSATLARIARHLHWTSVVMATDTPHCIEITTAAGITIINPAATDTFDEEAITETFHISISCLEDYEENETLPKNKKIVEEKPMLYIEASVGAMIRSKEDEQAPNDLRLLDLRVIRQNSSESKYINQDTAVNDTNQNTTIDLSSKRMYLITIHDEYVTDLDLLNAAQFVYGVGRISDNASYKCEVYERVSVGWRSAGEARASRDGTVRLSPALRRWTRDERRSAGGYTAATPAAAPVPWPLVLSAVAGTVAVIAVTTLLLTRLAVWVVRRRRRAEVVLAPEAVSWGAAGEGGAAAGMESMLACWLQQLREFGGPERPPDLLPVPPALPAAQDTHTRYKGDIVHLKYLCEPGETLELRSKATDVLLVMQGVRHENVNVFVGVVATPRAALAWGAAARGSLEDVLVADDIRLDWTFRLSLLTDLARGLRALHASPLRAHGRLSSRNCVVDARWVLRLTDYGLPALRSAQGLPHPPAKPRDLLWTAPEVLRGERGAAGSPAADIFAVGIIMQEVIVRGEPYCMMSLSPEEIVEKVRRPPPLIRPSVSMGAAPPEAVGLMRQCWAEAADARPDAAQLYDSLRRLHRGGKINIVDSMFEMLEKYSNNLEELIKERTEQLDLEKRRTEQLLNRMLPRSVAERLLAGARVEPEEFSDVTIYFSDIVGFTALAARSTPVQVVDLLNDLYTRFDAAIQQYEVYKVETIGDAYMVVGGLPVRSARHAAAVATMALHLLHEAGRFRIAHLPGAPLHLRSGVHSGPVCAAVVGATMPRYCLFGDAVNTAARMESTGAAWRVQLSAATAARLLAHGGFRLRSRGLTDIKGKGWMHTYWLLGKDGFDRPLPVPPPLPAEEALFESEAELDPGVPPAVAAPPSPSTARVARQHSDPGVVADAELVSITTDTHRASSADSSPPECAPLAPLLRAPAPDKPYSRYKCGRGGGRVLRRQWSLERGEALAAAAAGVGAGAGAGRGAGDGVLAPRAPRPAPRYRLRPDPP